MVTIAHASVSTSLVESQTDPEYDRWAEHNLMFQRQAGYGGGWVKLSAGTLFSSQMRGLAGGLEKNELTGLRIPVHQDLDFSWVPFDPFHPVFAGLRQVGFR